MPRLWGSLMTHPPDIPHAEAPELLAWLAGLPCPECEGFRTVFSHDEDGNRVAEVPCGGCREESGKEVVIRDLGRGRGGYYPEIASGKPRSTGLAFLWASEPCTNPFHTSGHEIPGFNECPICNGGRVPKAVGLEELFEQGITDVTQDPKPRRKEETYVARYGWSLINPPKGRGKTPTLAALRAVAQAYIAKNLS